jgi:UDP-N-acetylmuramoyl-tripeptide--D-alanyl-D-alanine ligase
MTIWTKSELITALSDQLLQHNLGSDLVIDAVVIDSRKTPKSGLFIALKGENNDGHNFLKQAFANGCRVALIDDLKAIDESTKEFILVKNTFVALYKLAEFSRQRSKAKIIAITGSVGKTSVKEILKLTFSTQGKTFATQGNLNNHIGLPLSLCNFSADCEYGIFEMGMNHLNEIEPLSKLTKPHLAIITNVGPVHIENFKNEEEIALAKSEIFCGLTEDGIALINSDNHHFSFLKKRAESFKIKPEDIISFAQKNSADYQILQFAVKDAQTSEVKAKLKNNQEISYQIASSNLITIFNSIIAIAAIDLLEGDLTKVLPAFKKLETPTGRGKIIEAEIATKKIIIIDDSYNASVLSMRAGLEHAANLKKILGKKRLVVALGDMLELGEKSIELHEKVIEYLQEYCVDFAVLVGSQMTKAAKNLPTKFYQNFPDSSSASLEIQGFLNDDDILYVKGSRGMKMEKIIENLINLPSKH